MLLKVRYKLSWLYRFFIVSKKAWSLPIHTEVVIYHSAGVDLISDYLGDNTYQVLDLYNIPINIFVLIKSILSKKFWKGRPDSAYVMSFLSSVKPKIVMSIVDNDSIFYEISSQFSSIKTIFFQNGTRDDWLDQLKDNRNWYVDAMFVHNMNIGKYYQSKIGGNLIPCGSLKNNIVPLSDLIYADDVLYLSQYHQNQNPLKPLTFDSNGKGYTWDEFFAIDELLIKYLDTWCYERGKVLRICGRERGNSGFEYQYYKNQIKKSAWIYEPNLSEFGCYQLVDACNIIVTVDSTLGYESLARGRKTAFFAGRGLFINNKARRFGWPGSLPENGPFWAASVNSVEVYRVLDYLAGESDAQWQKNCRTYAPQVMGFDPGNTIFQSVLQQFLTSEQTNYA